MATNRQEVQQQESSASLVDRLRTKQAVALAVQRALPEDMLFKRAIEEHYTRVVAMASLAAERGEGMSSRYWLGEVPRALAEAVLDRLAREGVSACLLERHTPIERVGDIVRPAVTTFSISLCWDPSVAPVWERTNYTSSTASTTLRMTTSDNTTNADRREREREREPQPEPEPEPEPKPQLTDWQRRRRDRLARTSVDGRRPRNIDGSITAGDRLLD